LDEYVFFNGQRVARRRESDAAVFYFFADHLGSSRVVTNAAGGIVEDSDFYPFGAERMVVDALDNNYKFTGKERDPETNTDYFNARQYAYSLGRFLQPDEFQGGPVDVFSSNDPLPPGPLPYAEITNPQSLNKYTYTWNNPVVYVDLNGHELKVADALLATVTKLEKESTTFKAEMDAARNSNKYNVSIEPKDPFQKVAAATVTITADDTINVEIKVDPGAEGDLAHEVGHGNDARTNTEQFKQDAADLNKQKESAFPNKVNDDDSPLDKRAEQFRKQVDMEKKQYRKEEKERKRKEKEEMKRERRKDEGKRG